MFKNKQTKNILSEREIYLAFVIMDTGIVQSSKVIASTQSPLFLIKIIDKGEDRSISKLI